jgi:hypothetical protein
MRLGIGEIEAARDGNAAARDRAVRSARRLSHALHVVGRRATPRGDDRRGGGARLPYHSISDHSWGRGRIGTLDPTSCARSAPRRELGDRYGIRTLCSSEVDIRADGSLDYDDAVLAELDLVIARCTRPSTSRATR